MEIEKFISLLKNKNEFYEHIRIEKRLSNNTVLSYKSDLGTILSTKFCTDFGNFTPILSREIKRELKK